MTPPATTTAPVVSMRDIPPGHSFAQAQWVVERATGVRFWACNCPSTPEKRRLRYVANNQGEFALPAEPMAKPNIVFQAAPQPPRAA